MFLLLFLVCVDGGEKAGSEVVTVGVDTITGLDIEKAVYLHRSKGRSGSVRFFVVVVVLSSFLPGC
jgi:hypothetical protein